MVEQALVGGDVLVLLFFCLLQHFLYVLLGSGGLLGLHIWSIININPRVVTQLTDFIGKMQPYILSVFSSKMEGRLMKIQGGPFA